MEFAYDLKNASDHLFNDYFFANESNVGDVFKPTRTRRVTITEVVDENVDWDRLDDGDEFHEEELEDVDEIFQLLSDVVDDWKLKLEWVVAEGLKKMRRSTKEKKTMMKYLPGNKLVGPAKESILLEWKSEFVKTLGSTQRKLEKLSNGKMKEVDKLTQSVSRKTSRTRDHDMNKNKKKLVHIECFDPDQDSRSISQLIKELDEMCQKLGKQDFFWKPHSSIFNQVNKKQIVPASPNPLPLQKWQNLQNFLTSKISLPSNLGNIYSELEAKQDTLEAEEKKASLMMLTKKSNHRLVGSNVVQARQRMRGRMIVKRGQKDEVKEKVGNYRLREVKRGGKKHFMLIKKREVVQPPVEEIFTDWKANLDQERIVRSCAGTRKPRVRKLSHRALRKAELKEAAMTPTKPLLYSDVVKKNLKLSGVTPIEDIFEAWRDYLQELDNLLSEDLSIPSSPEPVLGHSVEKRSMEFARRKREIRLEQDVIFASWRHNFVDTDVIERRCRKRRKTFDAENFFASWRHNFQPNDRAPVEKICSPENCFSAWRQIFDPVPSKESVELDLDSDPVDIFSDWMPNLFDDDDDFHPMTIDCSKIRREFNEKVTT